MTEKTPQNDEAELLESSKGQNEETPEQSDANSPAEAEIGAPEDSAQTPVETPSNPESSSDTESKDSGESIPHEEEPPAQVDQETGLSDTSDEDHQDDASAEVVSTDSAEQDDSESSEPKAQEEVQEPEASAEETPEDKTESELLSMESDVDLVDNVEDTRSFNVAAFRHAHKTVLLDRPDEALPNPEEDTPEPVFESEVKATEEVEESPAAVEGRETVVYHDLVEGELSFETQAPTLDEVMIPQTVEESDEMVDESHWTETAGLESDPDNFPYVSNMPKTVRMTPDEAGRVLDESSSDVPFTDIAALDPDFDKTTAEDLEEDSADPIFDRSRSESGEFEVAQLSPLEALEAVDEILDGTDSDSSDSEGSDPESSDSDSSDAEESAPENSAPESPDPERSDPERSDPESSNSVDPDSERSDPESSEPDSQEVSEDQAPFPADPAPFPSAEFPETPVEEDEPVFEATPIPEALPYDDSGDVETNEEKSERQKSETQLYNKVLVAPAKIEESDESVTPPENFDDDPSRRATKAMSNPLSMDEVANSLQEISGGQETTRFADPLTAKEPIEETSVHAADAPLEEDDGSDQVPQRDRSVSRSASGRLMRPPSSSNLTEKQKPSSLFSTMKSRRDSQKLSPRRRPTSSLVRPDLPKKSLNTPLRQYSSQINTGGAEQAPGRIRRDALEEIFKRWQDIKKEGNDP